MTNSPESEMWVVVMNLGFVRCLASIHALKEDAMAERDRQNAKQNGAKYEVHKIDSKKNRKIRDLIQQEVEFGKEEN